MPPINLLLPGLIQNHVHLVQMLARGYADDMKLLDWLKKFGQWSLITPTLP